MREEDSENPKGEKGRFLSICELLETSIKNATNI